MFGNTEKLNEIKESVEKLEKEINNATAELSNEIQDLMRVLLWRL